MVNNGNSRIEDGRGLPSQWLVRPTKSGKNGMGEIADAENEKRQPALKVRGNGNALNQNNSDAEQEPEQHAERNQRDRSDFCNRDLDP